MKFSIAFYPSNFNEFIILFEFDNPLNLSKIHQSIKNRINEIQQTIHC